MRFIFFFNLRLELAFVYPRWCRYGRYFLKGFPIQTSSCPVRERRNSRPRFRDSPKVTPACKRIIKARSNCQESSGAWLTGEDACRFSFVSMTRDRAYVCANAKTFNLQRSPMYKKRKRKKKIFRDSGRFLTGLPLKRRGMAANNKCSGLNVKRRAIKRRMRFLPANYTARRILADNDLRNRS